MCTLSKHALINRATPMMSSCHMKMNYGITLRCLKQVLIPITQTMHCIRNRKKTQLTWVLRADRRCYRCLFLLFRGGHCLQAPKVSLHGSWGGSR